MEVVFGIVAPAFNESEGIESWHRELRLNVGNVPPVVIVNDGSGDDTLEVLRHLKTQDPNLTIIDVEKNVGQQLALLVGLEYLFNTFPNIEYFVTMDSDGQDPSDLIFTMINEIHASNYEILVGARSDRSVDSFLKRFTANTYYRVMNRILDISLTPEAAEFRVIRRNSMKNLLEFQDRRPFWRGMVHFYTPRIKVFKYTREKRYEGNSSYGLREMLRLAEAGLVNFSEKPLRFVFWLGLTICFASILLGGYFLFSFILGASTISGWLSLSLLILFFGGVQIFCLGIIGIYILEIVRNSRGRPRYVIREII
jgi:glycosyltransferase involved in cell wall biosynthesis